MADGRDSHAVRGDDRFERFGRIQWWDQPKLRAARVLVVGAGALGNEVVKDLCLLGVGNLVIVDMDRIEGSNLSRSVLFRPGDQGRAKALVAARAAGEIYPDVRAVGVVGNVLTDVGLGYFRWAQIVVGALDNRQARVFVNRCCAQTGRSWIDGGIDVLGGIVRGFAPPQTACYECTMSRADWDQLARRRSCSLLARQGADEGGAPTTPTTASVIAAMQAQEVLKVLHGMEALLGRGFVFEGLHHSSYTVQYPIAPDCPWHEPPPPIETADQWGLSTPLRAVARWAHQRLGGLDAVDLAREMVERLECPGCGRSREMLVALDAVSAEDAVCPECGSPCAPRLLHSIRPDSPLMERTVGELGLPGWDVLWARCGEKIVGVELAGDRREDLAPG